MPKHLQFHAVAISILCIIVVATYFMIGPKPQAVGDPNGKVSGDRHVRIFTATWGMDCNENIRRMQEKPVKPDENGELPEPYELVSTDNVLEKLQEQCDGRLTCTLVADDTTLGPIYKGLSCYKKLQVGYRCYSYDRPWNIRVNQGSPLDIDCNEAADKARAKAEAEPTK